MAQQSQGYVMHLLNKSTLTFFKVGDEAKMLGAVTTELEELSEASKKLAGELIDKKHGALRTNEWGSPIPSLAFEGLRGKGRVLIYQADIQG